ncbi:unnamed protein product [Adineta ricciae]|uniref:Elongation factor EFG domain-containing protein n=2 Tax=Adineta ricciae TaxID=249248 RepID=A0A814N217_ADIRI|nr:unnamed protein product [Adineta ricciae]
MSSSIHSISYQTNQESSLAEHVARLKLYYRVCIKFVPSSQNKKVCVCNRPERHDHRKGEDDENWNMQTHTKPVLFEHQNSLINKTAFFVRIAPDTRMSKIKSLLLCVWQIPKSKLIMSIIGSTTYSNFTDRVESNLMRGIANVASKSNVWIITNGYNNRIVRLVGQAIKKLKLQHANNEIIAIGICKWGSVKNVQNLIDSDGTETIKQSNNGNRSVYEQEDEEQRFSKIDQYELEVNHSHYLMLDDGRYGYPDTEDFRTRLCLNMANLEKYDEPYTPVVTVAVGGDLDTIANIFYDLSKNVPVVITAGSGRACDFFTRWLLYTKQFDYPSSESDILFSINELHDNKKKSLRLQSHYTMIDDRRTILYTSLHLDYSVTKLEDLFKDYKTRLKNDLRCTFFAQVDLDDLRLRNADVSTDAKQDELLERTVRQVLFCLQPSIRRNITIFNLNLESSFSDTLFGSICRSYETSLSMKEKRRKMISEERNIPAYEKQNDGKSKLLQLAMDWNCIDVAKEFVLQNCLDNILNPEKIFIEALQRNLPAFIDEFLKLGVDPGEIFFPRNTFLGSNERYDKFLKDLYLTEQINTTSSPIQTFIDANEKLANRKIDSIDALNVIFRVLIGDYMHNLYFDTYKSEYEKRMEFELTKRNTKGSTDISLPNNETAKELAQDYIMRDLFLWAILMNYVGMAKVLLSHTKYRICPALIATKIFKEYHTKAIHEDLKTDYKTSATYFEQYAIDCLRECVENNADRACLIILQQNKLYGFVTCLQVAAEADDKSFIALPCCVEALNNIWYDKLFPEQSRKRDILALLLGFVTFGLTAPVTVCYREVVECRHGESLTKIVSSNGITYCDSYPLQYPRISDSNSGLNRYLHRWKNFHLSPMVKFCYDFVFYCFFLLLFSYVLLFDFSPPTNRTLSIHWTEVTTILLVSGMLIEEIRFFLVQDNLTLIGKSKNYFRDLFKLMTLLAFILFYIGLILRFVHRDSAHRRPDQLIPAIRRCLLASMHMAQPRLLEPIFLVDIECPTRMIGKVYSTLNKRRGQINEENELHGTTLTRIKAFLPVNESFGYTEELRHATSGTAFPQCQFDHWALLPGEPFELNTKCGQVVSEIRQRKALPEQVPAIETLVDRQ